MKKQMSRGIRQSLFGLVCIGLGACLPLLWGFLPAGDKELPGSQMSVPVISPKVLRTFQFAGETIPLTRADVRERMDRELTAFTYSHTLTMLMLKRANRIFPMVEPILKECGVPDDLKYLMVIESNLSPTAKSPAGAAGLWQFMPATGREYGLEVNANIDERYNFEKATRAACAYLKKSYELYGDWMTVAASYNGGQNQITRKLAEQQASNALDLWLLEETSRYMFRILAAKEVLSHPRNYGFLLKEEQLYPYLTPKEVLTIKEPIADLASFAKKQGVTLAQLKAENPWLRENSLHNKSGRTYYLRIPDAQAQEYDPSKTRAHNRAWVVD